MPTHGVEQQQVIHAADQNPSHAGPCLSGEQDGEDPANRPNPQEIHWYNRVPVTGLWRASRVSCSGYLGAEGPWLCMPNSSWADHCLPWIWARIRGRL